MVLLVVAGNTFADNLYVEDFTVAPGNTKTISIELVNPNSEYIMVEFWLSLPEGVFIPLDEDGYFLADGNATRFMRTHTLEVNMQDGYYHFLAYSSRNEAFNGNSGELISVTVEAAADAQAGTSTAKIFNQLYNDPLKNEVTPDDVTFDITIGETETEWTIIDETSPSVPEATDSEVDIKVIRTIKANEWSTLCLPFDMTETQVKDAFGEDVQLAEFVDYEEQYDEAEVNIIGIQVNFTESDLAADGLIANYPYIIKISSPIEYFCTRSIIQPDEDGAISEYAVGRGSRRHVYGTFYGTLHSGVTIPNMSLFLSGNNFYYSTGQTVIKGLRGYFTFEDVLSNNAGASGVSFNVDETDDIRQIKTEKANVSGVYDLQGRKIMVDGVQLKKGIYIIDGKKKVIK